MSLTCLKSGIWQVELRIPTDVRVVLGRTRFAKSTGTRDKREASNKALPIFTAWQQLIITARQNPELIQPKLKLFNGWGIYAQNFEGQILKNVMLEGVKHGIVFLPVHDAVAVPLDHIGWACEEMRYQWDKQMDVSGLARVSTDIPA